MKAIRLVQIGQPLQMQQIPIPPIGERDVLVRVKAAGICHSDVHYRAGVSPVKTPPVTLGHEVAGVVAETGKDVPGFAPGDKVVFMPQVTCGVCYPCRHGMYHICDSLKVMGFQTNGAAQEFFAVNAANVLKLPESMSLDQAALIEPISVAVHCLSRAGSTEGQKVLVLGGGTIGNLVAHVAQASGV